MSVIFFGTPLFAIPSLKALLDSGEELGAVVTREDKSQRDKRNRSRGLSALPVKEYAISRGIRVLQPASMKDAEFIRELNALRPEFIVVVAYGKIFPRTILDIPRRGAINLHASLLPLYRGASPIAWAIINGETETGVTTMLITEGVDEGDILLQETRGIEDSDTTESLSKKLSEAGAALMVKTLKGLREGDLKPRPQRGEPSLAPSFRKQDGRVDWSKTALELYNFTRGMHPWPGAYFYVDGERVRLLRVGLHEGEGEGGPGRIKSITGDSFLVGTGKGLVSVMELQPEGKRPMTGGAFLRGRKIKKGHLLDGI